MSIISCTCESLLKPVKMVSGIVERNQSLPVVQNILVVQNGADVSFTTTDLDIQIKTSAAVGAPEGNAQITIPAQKLNDILNTLKPTDHIELVDHNNAVVLSCPSGSFKLQALPASDFPALKTTDFKLKFSVASSALRYLFSMTAFAIAVKDIRYFLTGVFLEVEGNTVRAVSTDTHRLSYCETEVESLNFEGKHGVILPRKTIRELLRLLPEDNTPIEIGISESQICISYLGHEFISKLIEGTYPDYPRVIPTTEVNHNPLTVDREELLAMLRRVAVLTSDNFPGVRWTLSDQGTLTIEGTNTEQEAARQIMHIEWNADPLEIAFNVGYLMEALSILKTSKVTFHFASTARSTLMTMPDNMKYRYVIMPMRI